MPITDLTGTKWVFNDNITISFVDNTWNLVFSSNNTNYSTLRAKDTTVGKSYQIFYGSTAVWTDDVWDNEAYRIIEITGGTDVSNPDLIAWLSQNATYQEPVVTYTITPTLTHITSSNTSYSINEDGTWTTTLTADTNYELPSLVTVVNATVSSYNSTTGVLTLSNPTGNVTLTATAVAQVVLDYIAIEDYEVAHFNTGDMFIFQGKVIAIYTDLSEVDVTADTTFSGYNMSVAGTYAVTAIYGGKTTSFNIIVDGLEGWFVKGSLNDWQAMPKYNFKLHDADKPEGAIHQYLLTVDLDENDEFKFNLLNPETWLGLASIEEGGAKSNFETYNDNIRCKVAGKYRFYLKEFSNYYTVYAMYVPVIVNQNGSFATVTLKDNILTVGGVSYKLVGTTTGSEESTLAFKEIEAFVDNQGLINIRIGNATFKGEDYQQASNFLLKNRDYLETKDGLLFCVKESEPNE